MILLDYVLEWNYRSSEKQMTYTSLADILRYLRVYDSEFDYVYNKMKISKEISCF